MDDITLKINDAGHDMTFVIEKMSAFKAEGWLIRAGLLLGREAITAEGVKDYRGLVAALCKVEYEKAAPLLDELLACCKVRVGKLKKSVTDDGMIQSPLTLLTLRVEALKANFVFLQSANLSNFLGGQAFEPTVKA